MTRAGKSRIERDRDQLEALYTRFNHRQWVSPDPLQFLYHYESIQDREIAGLIAALLAYGRVEHILKSVAWVLDRIDPPKEFLLEASDSEIKKRLAGFRHRFTSSEALIWLLRRIRKTIQRYESLDECFRANQNSSEETIIPAVQRWAVDLAGGEIPDGVWILPDPRLGSACKRLHLYLRWMVRSDAVDPGGWQSIEPAKLIIPVDTHIHRIGLALGWTKRKAADRTTSIEITQKLRRYNPLDPVKYDFALSRLGIRREIDMNEFLISIRKTAARRLLNKKGA